MSWNVRRADDASAVWDYVLEVNADIALLQEVGRFPMSVRDRYSVIARRAVKRGGGAQSFSTAVITKFAIAGELDLRSDRKWVRDQKEFFRGNLVGASLRGPNEQALQVVSVHSPAWPVEREKWAGIDVSGLKLSVNPDIWCTEILWDLLRNTIPALEGQWIVGGDFNSSETLDLGREGDRGNREVMSRMAALGFTEVLRAYNGNLVPTFRHSRGGETVHQLDHIYVTAPLSDRLADCYAGGHERVFGQNMSDHLPLIAEFPDAEPSSRG